MSKQVDTRNQSERGNDLGRRRSLFVFEQARQWRGKENEEITAMAQGLPVTLRTQGLVVTMARLAAKDNTASRTLSAMLFTWLTEKAQALETEVRPATTDEFLEQLMTRDRSTYLAVQREALAMAERIKLISKAFFSGKERDHGA